MLSKNNNLISFRVYKMTTSFKLLKSILTLALFFSSCLWLIFLFILGGILLGYESSFGLEGITENFDVASKSARIVFTIYILIGYALIIYLIYMLRKLVISLNAGKLFTKFQSSEFNLVGQIIIWLVIINSISEFVFKLIVSSNLEVKASFPDFWLFLALGSFFIILGQVFEKARLIREENELTI